LREAAVIGAVGRAAIVAMRNGGFQIRSGLDCLRIWLGHHRAA
jgi:hypothetical protein